MDCRVRDIERIMEEIAPRSLAEEWDNVGLMVGDLKQRVNRVLVSLDVTSRVIEEARDIGAEMIVTHHPLLFKPMKNITTRTVEGSFVLSLIANGIAVYSAHTNLDRVTGGVDDSLAESLGLKSVEPLSVSLNSIENPGFGRIGQLRQPIVLTDYIEVLKNKLGIKSIDIIGNCNTSIKRIASCAGAGADFFSLAVQRGADLYVTGEMRYHQAVIAAEGRVPIVLLGHYASEAVVVHSLIKRLQKTANDLQYMIEVVPSRAHSDSFFRI